MRHLCWVLCIACIFSTNLFAADDYQLGADSMAQDGVPKGTITKHTFDKSKVFPGTVRDYWIYVPAQYKADGEPACVMIFQDGGSFVSDKGSYRAPVVMDNLIHKKDMGVLFFQDPVVPPQPRL